MPLLERCVIVFGGLDGLLELRDLFLGDGDLEIGDGITGVNVTVTGGKLDATATNGGYAIYATSGDITISGG